MNPITQIGNVMKTMGAIRNVNENPSAQGWIDFLDAVPPAQFKIIVQYALMNPDYRRVLDTIAAKLPIRSRAALAALLVELEGWR